MATKPKRPRDINQLAKLIVGIATGETEEENLDAGKNPKKVSSGRKGGKRGGITRMEQLTDEQRIELAKRAAAARWGKTVPAAKTGTGKSRSTKQN